MATALPPSSQPDRGDRSKLEGRNTEDLGRVDESLVEGPATPTPSPLRSPPPSFRAREGAPAAPRPPPPPSAIGGRLGPATPFPRPGPSDPTAPTRDALQRPQVGTYLSPRMTAIFGGIFGLATVTSIIALLIQVVPPRDERTLVANSPGGAPSGTAAAKPAAPVVKRPERVAIPGPWRLSELAKDPAVAISSALMERRSFIEALSEKGVPKAQSYRIMKALEGIRKFDKTGRKERFTVAVERATQRVRAFEYEVSPTEVYQAREGEGGLLVGSRLDMKIAESEFTGAFYVSTDLVESYKSGGFEDGVLATIDEALSGRLSTESFEEGGTVRMIAVEETALGLFARYKRLVAIEYRPPDPAIKPTRMYSFNGQASRGYFDEKGKQPYAGGWRAPITGAPVTSKFNPKRLHPVLKTVMPHNGTDFGAPTGTPVYAAFRGVVTLVGPSGPSGNLVTIDHASGITTGYAHLSRFAPGIKVGDKLGVRQLVGYVGSTGRSTGPHLHFSAKKDGKFFDAESLQLDGERVMPASDRPAFQAAKAELDKRLDAIPLPEPPPEKPKPVAAAASSKPGEPPSLLPIAVVGGGPAGAPGAGVVNLMGSAAAAAAAEPGIHPSQFIEDDSEDDDEGGEAIPAPALGAPVPGAPGPAPPAAMSGKATAGKPPPPDEPEEEDER